ncbi:MAG: ABC-ATPase domain-containing protein [Planctomycetota bacterium]
MQSSKALRNELLRIDGRGYKAYKDIRGSYEFPDFTLHIDYVQGDPFAAPSRIRTQVDQRRAGFPSDCYHNKSREVALRDYLTRTFHLAAAKAARGDRGSGKSGTIQIDRPRQEILERSSIVINERYVEARFRVGLPAFGRKIAGAQAAEMFMEEIPRIVKQSLFHPSLDANQLDAHIKTAEDADSLRRQLKDQHLVAFIANGAVLPRASGVDPRPLASEQAVAFRSPAELETAFTLPNKGEIRGLGIPEGIFLVVGGGYHGKSTLLDAVEQGIYNHIPGDGREYVATNPNAVRIRAEDGRRIEQVRITPFIANLPFGKDTDAFSSEDASGSTSQAANIMEALEVGAQVLTIDEDTSATNFMIRDHRMQELVAKDREPITPFIDKVRQIHRDHGVSTILVIGGSGDYFDVADRVICMYNYLPQDVTRQAQEITQKYKAQRRPEGGVEFGTVSQRVPRPAGFELWKGNKPAKIKPHGLTQIAFGRHTIDLAAVEQLVDTSQTRAIGDAIRYALKYIERGATLRETVEQVLEDMETKGLDVLAGKPTGDYARFRTFELAAAINRLRTLRVTVKDYTGRG